MRSRSRCQSPLGRRRCSRQDVRSGMMDRFDRSVRFFGRAGLALIQAKSITIVGAGGLGMHVIQQTALLGTCEYAIIDDQTLATTNLNRYVGVTAQDIDTPKVILAERLV